MPPKVKKNGNLIVWSLGLRATLSKRNRDVDSSPVSISGSDSEESVSSNGLGIGLLLAFEAAALIAGTPLLELAAMAIYMKRTLDELDSKDLYQPEIVVILSEARTQSSQHSKL